MLCLVFTLKLEPHRERRAAGKIDRLGERENRRVILAELRIHGPAGGRIIVERRGDGEVSTCSARNRRLRRRELDFLWPRRRSLGGREDWIRLKPKLPLSARPGPPFFMRRIRQRLEPQAR